MDIQVVIQELLNWEFTGGLVIRTPSFQSVAPVQSLVGELRSQKPPGPATHTRIIE